ncbi:response regulator [Lysobacter sp. CFH 32150]|uniref:response regulator n=1 Tax=Lysobacter sp. CFH 32150 TaxID=2927128 RepID=UPI001FA7D749|nr:response regulator [Lysobacter sp. CFH 32150]MCI4568497.1 response regulator [Lysobacter sp. CFH 32150]
MTEAILIVEDEADQAAIVADYVTAAGFIATVIRDGGEALASVRRTVPDLIVLDLTLPGLDGIALCQAVRAFSDVPIIMTTARVEEIDRLLGLEVGADDYLCKPLSPRELVARIKAILRRQRKPDDGTRLIEIDEATRTVRLRGRPLELTPTEYDLFVAMARRPGTIYSRAQLLDLARRDSLDVNDRAIDSHIKNLRRKISTVMSDTEVIHSIYGLGYRVDV